MSIKKEEQITTIKELEAERKELLSKINTVQALNEAMNNLGKVNYFFRQSIYKLERIEALKNVLKLMPELKAITTKGCRGTSANCYEINKKIDAFVKARIEG